MTDKECLARTELLRDDGKNGLKAIADSPFSNPAENILKRPDK